ncbi:MAG: TRAP transporter large permease subunit, partial [Chloroflexota bacterium]|nr:TRAP transporter large permease subunit [Chloroflexota bacterium]
MSTAREPRMPRLEDGPQGDREPLDAATADSVDGIGAADEPISDEQASRIIEEFESESPTRQVRGVWRPVAAVLAAGISIYALYYTQYSITTQVYRAAFLLLALVLTFLLYPMFSRDADLPTRRGWLIRGGIAVALGALLGRWLWAEVTVTWRVVGLLALLWFMVYPLIKRAFAGRPVLVDIPLTVAGALGLGYLVGLATQAYMGSRYGLSPATWRIAAIALSLLATAALYPLFRTFRRAGFRDRIAPYDVHLALMTLVSLFFLIVNYQSALQRITRPTQAEVLLGGVLIALALEATRRTTGWALPLVAGFFLLYALYGNAIPGTFGHRGYRIDRIVGQNYLTLEGLFGTPLEVAATFIVLFTIYGAVLEYSGAGKFFIDWSFAALGKSRGGTGPGRTVTAAGFLLGTVSGSGVATTVTLGSLAWPMLRRAGYNPNVAGGLLSAAGIGALLSPPTLGAAAFIIAEYLEVSYLQVLIYATVPTILYYLSCLLMIEADSRRMRTHAVTIDIPSLRELTLRYGYHFSSLFVIVILLAIGITPFMAVFLSIVVAFALSFLRPETRMTSLRALAAGAALAAVVLARDLIAFDYASLRGQGARQVIGVFAPVVARASFWGMMLTAAVAAA